MTTVLYPGSFDPATCGHLDIACRAAEVFDQVIVGVYDTPAKNVMFSTERRVAMFAEAVKDLPNIRVAPYSGLTVDFARACGATAIVRGLRAMTDFEYELQMASANRKLAPDIETVCLMTSIEHSFLSSSIVKEIAMGGGCIEGLVPPHIRDALIDAYKEGRGSKSIPRYLAT